jgi:hypothetical protein
MAGEGMSEHMCFLAICKLDGCELKHFFEFLIAEGMKAQAWFYLCGRYQ